MFDVQLLDEPFRPSSRVEVLAQSTAEAGGIASFIGQVRGGSGCEMLELSHYEPLTLPGMIALANAARERFELRGLVMLHRTGTLAPGEPIVCVAAAATHRRAALDAVDFCMDHLKCAAWFWKRERRGGEWHWIEPRAEDHAALSRWSVKRDAV